jgi:hypothetical protein
MDDASVPPATTAQPPAIPSPTPELLRARAEAEVALRLAAVQERRSLTRGLLLLAAIVLVLSMVRAGWGRVFVPGWWHQW